LRTMPSTSGFFPRLFPDIACPCREAFPNGSGERAGMDDRKRIAAAIKDHLARERMSREQFAFKTKLGKSTVDKLLTGLFSDRTLAIVEDHTKLPLRQMLADSPAGGAPEQSARSGSKPLDRPSIAVLPFANLSGDPERDYLSDGITEDIITALARLRWLLVIARNSTFVYKGKAVDVRQVARELGVRYVLEGSVRTAGPRIRITGQLIDAETGKHIWAERYDRDLRDIFLVQDDITERVVAAVEPHLYAEEGFRASGKPPDSIDAWGLVVRALGLLSRVEREKNEDAQTLLRRAIEVEPSYARAHAFLGWALWWQSMCLWRADTAEGYRRAAGHAQDALALDPTDPWARMIHGLHLSTAGQHERALGELQKALDLNPSFALGHTTFGWALLRAGYFDEAIDETGRALRMSPLDSFSGLYTSVHGLALLGARRFEEALPFLRASVAAFKDYSGHYNTLISCCGHLGLIEEAREFIAARGRIAPPLRLSWVRDTLRNFAHCDVFVEGLSKAGVPE
jgi:adenylate cyclase